MDAKDVNIRLSEAAVCLYDAKRLLKGIKIQDADQSRFISAVEEAQKQLMELAKICALNSLPSFNL